MRRFAALLDRLAYEPGRHAKLRLLVDYFRTVPDPDRGWALAALTGGLSFRHAKPAVIRALIGERTDPVLFAMSYDYVGDLSETVALMWPSSASPLAGEGRGRGYASPLAGQAPPSRPAARGDLPHTGGGDPSTLHARASPPLAEVVTTLRALGKSELPGQLARWLDALDETGRWALLKLVTGALRIGVSARLAKTAVAMLGGKAVDDVELLWPGLVPPYTGLFAWIEGRGERPAASHPAPFRPPMLAHPITPEDFPGLDPADFSAEWKWDGIRVQAVATAGARRLYSRTGEDISNGFPDLVDAFAFDGAIDGELLILREGRVQSFNALQQRLNRKSVDARLFAEFPAHLRAYDLLVEGDDDLRERPFGGRRARLERLIVRLASPRIDLSPLVPFASWDDLARVRADPAGAGAEDGAAAVEGVMLKRRDAPYLPGRPRGLWWKWKRDPMVIDAVLMYAQRGHGKRSSFYSDYTFGVWTGAAAAELVPVGKAYFGFTDAELLRIDRFVRDHTVDRFGPVREVAHAEDQGLVLEVAFEGLARSSRHKSGLALRFPRINRLRWDKPPGEADRLETLTRMLEPRGDDAAARPRTARRKG